MNDDSVVEYYKKVASYKGAFFDPWQVGRQRHNDILFNKRYANTASEHVILLYDLEQMANQ